MMDQETSSGTSSSGTDSADDDLPFGGSPAVYCTNCTSRLVLGTVCMVSSVASCLLHQLHLRAGAGHRLHGGLCC